MHPTTTPDEINDSTWGDAELMGLHWSKDRVRLMIDLQLAAVSPLLGTENVRLECRWTTDVDVNLKWENGFGGPAMAWGGSLTKHENGWRVHFDFADLGELSCICEEIVFVAREAEAETP